MNEKTETTWVINTSDATFQSDVFDRSNNVLVVLDFWAPWCAPCRAIGPILEKLAAEFNGRFLLVKANTDDVQAAATQFGVSGIPAVFAVVNQEIVDGFQGAMPEASIRQWLGKLLQSSPLLEIEKLMSSDISAAEQKLHEFISDYPNEDQGKILLAELRMLQDQDSEARQIIEQLGLRGFLEPRAEKIKAALSLKADASIDLQAARVAAQSQPNNFELQLSYAKALAAKQSYEEAFEVCLSLVTRDRKQTGEQARQLMVEIFRILPDDSPLTSDYRRKLSSALY